MRAFTKFLLIFLVVTYSVLPAQDNITALAVLEWDPQLDLERFESIEIPIYYQFQHDMIVGLSPTQMIRLNNLGVPFKIIDTQPWSEDYFILTHRNVFEFELIENWGREIYRTESALLVKAVNLPFSEVTAAGFQVTRLTNSPYYLKNQKIHSSPQESIPDFTGLNEIIQEIDADSVRNFIQNLQDFGTRFLLASNRDSVADWIKNQFIRFGISDVQIDSFLYSGLWQYNVIATIPGMIYPGKVYIVGGHHDSYSSGNPTVYAPGADDNASGTAAVLEIARAIMTTGYQPEATVKFITFAAEEYGLHGSHDYAQKAQAAGMDIGLMINHDMISYTTSTPGNWRVSFNYYTGSEHFLNIAYQLLPNYTTLLGANGTVNASFSDSYSFWSRGFPAFYFEEYNFSPFYHSPNDVISNYNMDFCAEVIKASAALLVVTSATPVMVEGLKIADNGNGHSLNASWIPNSEPDLGHYNVYMGLSSGVFDTVYTTTDSSYDVTGLLEGITYFIGVSAVDTFGNESFVVEKSGTPYSTPQSPKSFNDRPQFGEIELIWHANHERDLWGYNLYRSLSPGGTPVKMNQTVIVDTVFLDFMTQNGVYYYYTVKAIDSTQNESEASDEIRSRTVSLDGGILIVDETADGNGSIFNPTDEAVDSFYAELLQGFLVTEYDLATEAGIKLADLGAFSSVVWHGDDFTEFAVTEQIRQSLQEYLNFGGNLLVSSYHPSQAFAGVSTYPANFTSGDFINDYLKISQVEFTAPARFKGAISQVAYYDSVFVDSTKSSSSLNYHLLKVESIQANSDADEVFGYETEYSATSSMGALKGKPVGVEYIGSDFKTVTLSFPLFYQQFQEAKELVHTIMTAKFDEVLNIADKDINLPNDFVLEQNYPNPFNPSTTFRYYLKEKGSVKLAIYDLLGQKIKVLVDEHQDQGMKDITWDGRDLRGNPVASGIYIYRLEAGHFVQSRKMILLK